MEKEKVKKVYSQLYNVLGVNYFRFEPDDTDFKNHFTPYIFSSLDRIKPYEFRSMLVKGIHFCVKNGHFDVISQDKQVHKKHELFFKRLNDDSYSKYEALRKGGFFDEEDFLLWLDDTVRVAVKTYETREILLRDPNTSIYFEYNPTICGIEIYMKIIFERHYMCIDIHTNDENDLNAF